MKRRFISLFIATAAILSACCGVFYAQNADKEVISSQKEVSKDFTFSLDTAKKALKLCSIAGYPVSINAWLELKGYSGIEFFQYENGAKTDNKAGLVLAFKDSTLLAIVRGTQDEEWYSNFYIGEGYEHAGFSLAADLAIENIKSYCNRHDIIASDTELFATGHSRGAAVVNMLSARLIDEDSFKYISAYTFASPNTTTDSNAASDKYNSIVNIINPQDFICYIPLPEWGYTRFGQTIELPAKDSADNFDELYEKMETEYLSSTGKALKDFPHKGQDVKNIISYLSILAPTPEDYYDKELTVGGLRLTMYDYMMKLAAVMNNENPLLHGLFMLSCKSMPEVSPITEFVFSGMSKEEIKTTTSLDNTAVVANHMHDAYFAWLNTLPESYFTDRLK